MQNKKEISLDKYKKINNAWKNILIPSKDLSKKVQKNLTETDQILIQVRYGE